MKPASGIVYAIVVDAPRSLTALPYVEDVGTSAPPLGTLVIAPGPRNSKPCYFDSATGALIPESSLSQGETPVWTTFDRLPEMRAVPPILPTSVGAKSR